MPSDAGDRRSDRRDYAVSVLRRADLPEDPLTLFAAWLDAAVAAGAKDATAMALATVGASGMPSVRIVLLKHYSAAGFCWYTDYRSQKGTELAANANASTVFYWRDFDRQVRVSGSVVKVDVAESREYFASRPLDSRLSAAASRQSVPVADRRTLEERVAELARRHPDGNVPKPEEWGGYRLEPASIEFWQGREGRLHDRFRYTRTASAWRIERLQP